MSTIPAATWIIPLSYPFRMVSEGRAPPPKVFPVTVPTFTIPAAMYNPHTFVELPVPVDPKLDRVFP